jgi:hypothetical protein
LTSTNLIWFWLRGSGSGYTKALNCGLNGMGFESNPRDYMLSPPAYSFISPVYITSLSHCYNFYRGARRYLGLIGLNAEAGLECRARQHELKRVSNWTLNLVETGSRLKPRYQAQIAEVHRYLLDMDFVLCVHMISHFISIRIHGLVFAERLGVRRASRASYQAATATEFDSSTHYLRKIARKPVS